MNDEVYRCEICGNVPEDKNFYNPYLCAECGKKVCNTCKDAHNVTQHGYQAEGKVKPMSMIEKIQAEARKKVETKFTASDDDIPF
jgi:hypothetical protein